MEYFVVILNNEPVATYLTMLEALKKAKEYNKVILHRIHMRDGRLVVQEINVGGG